MHSSLSRSDLLQLAASAYDNDILRQLEAPDPGLIGESDEDAAGHLGLFALHLGAAFHRRAIMVEVMRFYAGRNGLGPADYPGLALVEAADDEGSSRRTARSCYAFAVSVSPGLAEAHFSLGRISQMEGAFEAALESFDNVLAHQPHERATPHAHLLANAHWERATLLEDLGRDEEALTAYRSALASLSSFGVHHVRAARFFRRMNCLEESIAEFRKGMGYTHRYFPEFLLPALTAPEPAAPAGPQAIHETAEGEIVVFWQGEYYALPADVWRGISRGETDLTDAHFSDTRHAVSIARLEKTP